MVYQNHELKSILVKKFIC